MNLKYRLWRAGRELGRKIRLVRPDNWWGTQQDQFFDDTRNRAVLFFSPHQDDEVISLGVPIAELSVRGRRKDLRVVLCSDGAASKVRRVLNNGKDCDFHEGPHTHELTTEEFAEARDREFMASCERLGVPAHNVHVPPQRLKDGEIDPEGSRNLILEYLKKSPDAAVCLIGPSYDQYDASVQHPDHRVLAQAALDLYNEGTISKLILFMEPSGVRNFRINNPGVRLTRMKASPAAGVLIEAAALEYDRWDPEAGRYSIGGHSVRKLLENIASEQTSYFWIPKRA